MKQLSTAEKVPTAAAPASHRWSKHIFTQPPGERSVRTHLIGVLPGEGIGPEVTRAALDVLKVISKICSTPIEIVTGGEIGLPSLKTHGKALSPQVVKECSKIFASGGAIFAGAGGDRFVYEMRREFNLYCKLNPLVTFPELCRAGRLQPEHTPGIDVMVVRDNAGGVYQGEWSESASDNGERRAEHRFSYCESQVMRVLQVAAAIATQRRGELTLVVKPNGVPSISRLWSDCAQSIAQQYSVRLRELEIDYAAYQLIQHPQEFDVVVTANLFGDILSDLGGVLLGSRGMCFGGSFSAEGFAVYQTNHGAAYDLSGTDSANPIGQMLSLAMLLRESFGLDREANLLRDGIALALRRGYRTRDIAESTCRTVGTREMATHIAAAVESIAGS